MGQLLANGVIAGSTYALIAIGFALVYNTGRFFHFAHGAVFTWGAYFAFFFVKQLGLPLGLGSAIAVGTTALLGVSIEIFIYRPLRHRGASSLILLIASLGVFILLQNFVSLLFGDESKILRSAFVTAGIDVFGARITLVQIAILTSGIVLFSAVASFLAFSRMGKAIRAVADDPELAMISGIDSDRVFVAVIALGSALAGIGAILIALDTDMRPAMGFSALLMGVVAVFIGGVGKLVGAAFGGLFLGIAQQVGSWPLGAQWRDAIAFSILLIFLLFRPTGFFGRPNKTTAV
jgi:branched-chain amino acid transport system permease protein